MTKRKVCGVVATASFVLLLGVAGNESLQPSELALIVLVLFAVFYISIKLGGFIK